jgi:hypothetical protein
MAQNSSHQPGLIFCGKWVILGMGLALMGAVDWCKVLPAAWTHGCLAILLVPWLLGASVSLRQLQLCAGVYLLPGYAWMDTWLLRVVCFDPLAAVCSRVVAAVAA